MGSNLVADRVKNFNVQLFQLLEEYFFKSIKSKSFSSLRLIQLMRLLIKQLSG
jgi:hypothetical protein